MQEDHIPPPVDANRELETIRANLREIAHEINNPLGVLRMTAYFLDRGDVSAEKLAEYAGLINQSLDRIESGMKRLNDLRRGQTPPAAGS